MWTKSAVRRSRKKFSCKNDQKDPIGHFEHKMADLNPKRNKLSRSAMAFQAFQGPTQNSLVTFNSKY